MDFDLSEDQRAIEDAARAFAAAELAPHSARWDEEKMFSREVLQAAAAMGFAGLYVQEDVGGSALSRLDASLVFEQLSYGDPVPGHQEGLTSVQATHDLAAVIAQLALGDLLHEPNVARVLRKQCCVNPRCQLLLKSKNEACPDGTSSQRCVDRRTTSVGSSIGIAASWKGTLLPPSR